MPKEQREWRIDGRERVEWDTALLAEVVLAVARARVEQRRSSRKKRKSSKSHATETTR
jgi:hypothetical protein